MDLGDLRGWHLVLPDAVHPTAVGQVVIAERAARALALAGQPVPHPPAQLAEVDRSLAGALRYAPAHARAVLRDLGRRAREGAVGASTGAAGRAWP